MKKLCLKKILIIGNFASLTAFEYSIYWLRALPLLEKEQKKGYNYKFMPNSEGIHIWFFYLTI